MGFEKGFGGADGNIYLHMQEEGGMNFEKEINYWNGRKINIWGDDGKIEGLGRELLCWRDRVEEQLSNKLEEIWGINL